MGSGWSHTYIITNEAELWMWGAGSNHQLGNGTTTDTPTPFLFPHKVYVPFSVAALARRSWRKIYTWIVLAVRDEGSAFFGSPVEVVYHFATIAASTL
jgi:hypothetical protein